MTFENEKQRNEVLKNIAALLHYGKYNGVSPQAAKLIYLLMGIIFAVPVTIGVVLVAFCEPLYEVLVAFGVAGVYVLVCALFIYLCIRGQKQRKTVLSWLEDAVELKAVTKEISRQLGEIIVPCVKIQVDFYYGDKLHRQFSDGKRDRFDDWPGYLALWKKYADREIDILYSPKYDEVMVLKAPLSIAPAKPEE